MLVPQDNNWAQLYKFNDFVNDLLVEDIKNNFLTIYPNIANIKLALYYDNTRSYNQPIHLPT